LQYSFLVNGVVLLLNVVSEIFVRQWNICN